ncbi:MAG: hypothetical protein HYW86_05530 [Candidatus Roizmanbacteria bacterium]|nr:MAG: hypothetical protein HYW86_05530 [Candidatus Roizmanbacteria bacterium]
MIQLTSFVGKGLGTLRFLLDPAVEGNPYGSSFHKRKKQTTDKPRTPLFRRRLAWR